MNYAGKSWGKAILLALSLVIVTAPSALAAARKTVVVLGDSLAAGYGVEPAQAYPALLQEKIDAAGLPFTIVNAGVSGDTTADGLGRVDWLLQRRTDVLIVELGGNDGLRGIPVGTIESNLQAIIDHARKKYPEIKIVIAGMRMPANLGPDYVDAFAKVFPEIARRNRAALVPFLLEGVGGDASLNQPDGIHPTPAGHKIVAENVWKVLKPVLESDN
ncbi:MAG TPA: arylesterase [Candidatus Baltobacteraceae bacterium]|jgi:acyl-CoA thioesterase-1|nr:arylesterase [Candidatus Baltobacteraceae bacterium]